MIHPWPLRYLPWPVELDADLADVTAGGGEKKSTTKKAENF